ARGIDVDVVLGGGRTRECEKQSADGHREPDARQTLE
ncbi:MAG: hypothetical protein QOH33_1971, partial [Paraburkholderia sp.]|nr:hypothetical protein [Paraburkholderia sp.]